MGRTWVEYALGRDDVEICGVVDIVIEHARAYKEQFKLDVPEYLDVREALAALKPDIVFDTATPEAHYDITSAALAAGCHVLGEKPMTGELDTARAILPLVAQSGKTFAVMQNRRYTKPIQDYKSLLGDGGVGRLTALNADFFIGAHFGGFRDLMDNVLLLDMAIHSFDQARFLCGGNAVSAYCLEFNPPWSWYRGAASAVVIYEMDNGCVFTYRGSWCAEGCPTEWECEWRAVGEFGSAVWKTNHEIYAELVSDMRDKGFIRPIKRVEPNSSWDGRPGHFGCLDAMFEALAKGEQPETCCQDNIHSIEMVFAAIESARIGQKVKVGL